MAIYPVILAGGSGTRLWPLSRQNHPKQFLDLLDCGETLLQSSIQRARKLANNEPLIIAHKDHRFLLQHQIEQIDLSLEDVLLEPCSRNTGAAIALACLHILEKDKNAMIVVLPSDHYISDSLSFAQSILDLTTKLEKDEVGLIGIQPTFASSSYGYFELDASGSNTIEQFIEKPSMDMAENLIKNEHFAWNSGVVVARAQSILKAYSELEPDYLKIINQAFSNQSKLYDFHLVGEEYKTILNQSFDVMVLERYSMLKGVRLCCEWDDLGTWARLLDRRKSLGLSQYSAFSDKDKTLMFAQDEVVLVENDDLIFVAKQDDMQDMQAITQYLYDNELTSLLDRIDIHRPWGQFKVLAKDSHYVVKHLVVHPKAQISLQSHHHRNENWVVIRGIAEVQIDGEVATLSVGSAITIKKNQIHRLANNQDGILEIIEVQTGNYLNEDDIVRYDDQYLRHLNH